MSKRSRVYVITPPLVRSLNQERPPYGRDLIRPLPPAARKLIFSKPPKSMGLDRPAQSKAGQP